MRGSIYETIFALLAGLGLRIGEVSRLQCGDLDLERDVLQIRDSKFGKSRLVPFGPRLATRVRAYLELRERDGWPCTGSAPLFSWNGTSPISTNTIRNTFRDELLPPALEYRPEPRVHAQCATLVRDVPPVPRGPSRAAQSSFDIRHVTRRAPRST
jgi:integrase